MKWLKSKINLDRISFFDLGNYVMYISDENISWGRISKDLFENFKKYDGCEVREFYNDMMNSKIVQSRELIAFLKNLFIKKSLENIYKYNSKTAFVLVTKRCNLKCTTCYVNSESFINEYEMTQEEIKGVFIKLINAGYNYITISGGEPFLRRDIESIILLAKEYFDGVSVNTNGTLLDEKRVKFLKENNVKVMISLEGAEAEINDKIRGKGTQEKIIIKAIKYFKES